MVERRLQKAGAWASVAVAGLSVLYAIAYLVITPSAQRGSNTTKALLSYAHDPAGLRIAAVCLLLSGLAIPVAWIALTERLRSRAPSAAALIRGLGVVAGLATAAHGLADLVGFDKLARTFERGDAAARAAVRIDAVLPSTIDPRGLFTFGVTGAAVLGAGLLLRDDARWLGVLGIVLGADMMLLFIATATGVSALVLATGALASIVLGPLWWVLIARLLLQPAPADSTAAARQAELAGRLGAERRVTVIG